MFPSWLRSSGRRHLFVLLVYTGMVLLATWPLARYFTTHTPGDGIDDPALTWNLWWTRFRLVDQLNPDLFHVDWMFHPIQINLAFYTLTPLNGLVSTPLQVATSLIVAANIVLLSSFVLAGYGAFLLTLDLLGRLGARNVEPGDQVPSGRRRDAVFVA
ncbi:MAG: hypothetical protein IPK16_24475, partial [Anaerolineales bacterium]|nr:hypothetical protein [Anaerolineales bacterium]